MRAALSRTVACLGILVALAAPALAGGRGHVNPAWLDTLELASALRQAPQATPEEIAELARRMAPLAAEQRRLLAEAGWLDAEEGWLVAENARINAAKAKFETACAAIADEDQLNRCQALVDQINRDVEAYNARFHPFAPREATYTTAVVAWLASLDEIRAWMRPILSRRTLTPPERALLEKERARLRIDVDGLQEALRRLAAQHTTTEEERLDWEKRYEEATARAKERLRDYLADQAIEQAQGLLEACSGRLTAKIRAKIDQRINVKGGSAPDKDALVKALDAEVATLVKDRAEVDSAAPALGRAWAAVKNGAAALDASSWEDRKKALETMSGVVGDVLGDPAVQRALRISEVPATVYTLGKLISDSAFDITTEILAIRRLGAMDRESDDYLNAVTRLDEQMKKKVGRLAEVNRLLGGG